MKKNLKKQMGKNWKYKLFIALCISFLIAILTGLVCTEIYVWINYGGKSIEEIPMWALIFMLGGGRK